MLYAIRAHVLHQLERVRSLLEMLVVFTVYTLVGEEPATRLAMRTVDRLLRRDEKALAKIACLQAEILADPELEPEDRYEMLQTAREHRRAYAESTGELLEMRRRLES